MVGNPPTNDELGVLVAQNRGTIAELFASQQDALKWLDPNSGSDF